MSDYKEFTGKDLDQAIQEACKYFDLERGKLELEIVSGGSSGIFGLVGKKKAVVRARPLAAASIMADAKEAKPPKPQRQPQAAKPERHEAERSGNDQPADDAERRKKPSKPKRDKPGNGQAKAKTEAKSEAKGPDDSGPDAQQERKPKKKRPPRRRKPKGDKPAEDKNGQQEAADFSAAGAVPLEGLSTMRPDAAPSGAPEPVDMPDDDMADDLPDAAPDEEILPLDNPELDEYLRKATVLMTAPIIGEAEITIGRTSDRIRIHIGEGDGSGLLIGRDGQNLNAMQYLLNRMVGKQWPDEPKVQLDAGDYRERLDDKLRKMAHFLAGKAADSGKVQSTKPLSSYHRRVVHLALQDKTDVHTRSKGDGPLKRVLILPKRKK